MNIQELLGEAYKEGMSLDEINEAIKDKSFVDESTLPPTVSKSVFDTTSKELASAKKKIKELETASMTDSEKLQKALEDAENTKKEYLIKGATLEVEKVFVGAGLTQEDYAEVIGSIVSEDSTTSVEKAKALVKLIDKTRKTAQNEVKKSFQDSLTEPKGTGTGSIDSYESIMNISDTSERQQKIAEYLEQNERN